MITYFEVEGRSEVSTYS